MKRVGSFIFLLITILSLALIINRYSKVNAQSSIADSTVVTITYTAICGQGKPELTQSADAKGGTIRYSPFPYAKADLSWHGLFVKYAQADGDGRGRIDFIMRKSSNKEIIEVGGDDDDAANRASPALRKFEIPPNTDYFNQEVEFYYSSCDSPKTIVPQKEGQLTSVNTTFKVTCGPSMTQEINLPNTRVDLYRADQIVATTQTNNISVGGIDYSDPVFLPDVPYTLRPQVFGDLETPSYQFTLANAKALMGHLITLRYPQCPASVQPSGQPPLEPTPIRVNFAVTCGSKETSVTYLPNIHVTLYSDGNVLAETDSSAGQEDWQDPYGNGTIDYYDYNAQANKHYIVQAQTLNGGEFANAVEFESDGTTSSIDQNVTLNYDKCPGTYSQGNQSLSSSLPIHLIYSATCQTSVDANEGVEDLSFYFLRITPDGNEETIGNNLITDTYGNGIFDYTELNPNPSITYKMIPGFTTDAGAIEPYIYNLTSYGQTDPLTLGARFNIGICNNNSYSYVPDHEVVAEVSADAEIPEEAYVAEDSDETVAQTAPAEDLDDGGDYN